MPVGSTIEMYTMLLAWFMYESLWDLLASTGILMIPFIVASVQLFLDDNVKHRGVQSFVSAYENKMYVMVFMMFFTVAPYINVYASNITYTELTCVATGESSESIEKQATTVTYQASNTTADNASTKFMGAINGSVPKMPMWWYIWQRLSIAFTNALKQMLPCNPDFRSLSEGMGSMVIKDDDLKYEVGQFHDDCWKNGVTRYWRDTRNGSYSLPASLGDLNVEQDIAWIGSQILLGDAEFYPALRAVYPVKAFAYRALVDGNKATEDAAGGHGFPYCDEWWKGIPDSYGQPGLRERLLSHIKSQNSYSGVKSWWDYYWSNSTALGDYSKDDFLLRTAFSNSEQLTLRLNRDTERDSGAGSIMDGFSNFIGNFGIAYSSIGNRAEANVYRSAAPIVQAFLMMLLIMFLPLLLVVGLYDIAKTLTLSVVMFALVFWGYLFELANYLDNFLLATFMAANSDAQVNMASLSDLVSYQLNTSRAVASDDYMTLQIIQWITRSAYVLLPTMFSWLFLIIGLKVGTMATDGLSTFGGGAAKGAKSGADMAVGTAKSLATKGR